MYLFLHIFWVSNDYVITTQDKQGEAALRPAQNPQSGEKSTFQTARRFK